MSSKRQAMFSPKVCIGERDVGVPKLIEEAPAFQALYLIAAICSFLEQTGSCLELIREFYMRAGYLEDSEGGPYVFKTTVRGVHLDVTPNMIASVL